MTIFNVGKVPFNFKIGIGKPANAKIEVIPSGGLVPSNEKVRLSVKFTPTSPDRTEEQFTIQVFPILVQHIFKVVLRFLERKRKKSQNPPFG